MSPVSPAPLMPTTKLLDCINPLFMKRNVVPRSLTDVHVSMDNVVIMCHDPSLDRTTDANGIVQQKNWYGDTEHARTLKKGPDGRGYPVPTFKETIDLLMRVRCLFHLPREMVTFDIGRVSSTNGDEHKRKLRGHVWPTLQFYGHVRAQRY